MSQPYKEITLTSTNTSENMTNPAGSLEISGNFSGPATVTQNLTGGSVAVDTFAAAETVYTKASHSTFSVSGADGSTAITVRWYYDVSNSNESPVNRLSKG